MTLSFEFVFISLLLFMLKVIDHGSSILVDHFHTFMLSLFHLFTLQMWLARTSSTWWTSMSMSPFSSTTPSTRAPRRWLVVIKQNSWTYLSSDMKENDIDGRDAESPCPCSFLKPPCPICLQVLSEMGEMETADLDVEIVRLPCFSISRWEANN